MEEYFEWWKEGSPLKGMINGFSERAEP